MGCPFLFESNTFPHPDAAPVGVNMVYDLIDTPLGPVAVTGDHEGIRQIAFQHGKHPLKIEDHWQKDPTALEAASRQLESYFAGELQCFDLALAPVGTDFQQRVWQALRQIPYGHLVSYRDIAVAIGNPKACRAVGGANGKNPIPIVIPCHRVIGSQGQLVGYGEGLDIKRQLIDLEYRFL